MNIHSPVGVTVGADGSLGLTGGEEHSGVGSAVVGSIYQGLLQNISDHPSPREPTPPAWQVPRVAVTLLWRISQLLSRTDFLLLPHPASSSRMGTAHYDITWLSPIPGEVGRSNSLPTPSHVLPQASQKSPISKRSSRLSFSI